MERNNKRTFKKIGIWVLKHQYINYKNFILNRVTTGCPISFVEKKIFIVDRTKIKKDVYYTFIYKF